MCVCVCLTLRLHCVCEREDERSHSYNIKQDFPEHSAPATELPKSSSGFPPQHKLGVRAESPLFVLERHCSGAAEAMSQRRRQCAHLPRFAQLLNVCLLLCHLASLMVFIAAKSFAYTYCSLEESHLFRVKLF